MEGRKFGFRTAANDNFPERPQAKTPEAAPVLDAVRLGALRQKVSDVVATYPFLLSSEKVEEAMNAVSGMTRHDIIRIINKVDSSKLEDTNTHFYQALLRTLDQEIIED